MWEVSKIQDFCPRDMESCHLAAAGRMKLWSLNANLFFKEPWQLTKFTWWVHLNKVWQRTFHFKDVIAIFLGLQTLLAYSLKKPDFSDLGCSSGQVLSKTKSVTPHFFLHDLTSLTHHLSMVKFAEKKSMLENFRANVLKVFLASKSLVLNIYWMNNASTVALHFNNVNTFDLISIRYSLKMSFQIH